MHCSRRVSGIKVYHPGSDCRASCYSIIFRSTGAAYNPLLQYLWTSKCSFGLLCDQPTNHI